MQTIEGTNTQIELDDSDRRIIEMLRVNGRASFAEMAKMLDVSPGMVRVRYNRLVKSGCLRVTAISNPLNLGLETMAMIGIRVSGEMLMEVAEKISGLDEVIYLVITSGSYDILAEVRTQSQGHLLKFLTEKLYQIEGVRESESFLHLKILKEIYY